MGTDQRRDPFDRHASQLARTLIGYGVAPGTPVVVAVDFAQSALLARSAVAQTGAEVVVVDPTLPPWRAAALIAEAGAEVGITLARHTRSLPDTLLWVELDSSDVWRESARQRPGPLDEQDLIPHHWLPARAVPIPPDADLRGA
ncbi:MAG TPA: AMP-binding protein [Aldersonia sp.]